MVSPDEVEGSFLMHVYKMCNNSYRAVMELPAGGPVDSDRVCAARTTDGLADSLQFVLQGNCEASRRLLMEYGYQTCASAKNQDPRSTGSQAIARFQDPGSPGSHTKKEF